MFFLINSKFIISLRLQSKTNCAFYSPIFQCLKKTFHRRKQIWTFIQLNKCPFAKSHPIFQKQVGIMLDREYFGYLKLFYPHNVGKSSLWGGEADHWICPILL
jgi:hypothetical protein